MDKLPTCTYIRIFRALAYIHGTLGVCHRDIKTQNVLLHFSLQEYLNKDINRRIAVASNLAAVGSFYLNGVRVDM
ncbi:hypothetical protein Taro_008679 [Colocasia esculenta]|uniref:Protein kinase domain-containing protein n=1 Tax=Colocasia esculenta TaxID=4460 RepID=A0A843TXW2_COLES|nr:hypothetical protein [Colocasia esculenta]